MRLSRCVLLLFVAGHAHADIDGFLLGGGLETDTDDGLRGSVIAGVGLSDKTWLSGGFSASTVELRSGRSSETVYGDIELDHHFEPLGIRIGAAYWGDPDLLDSVDLRASLYFRTDRVTLAGEYELRDFDLSIPPSNFFPGREVSFEANGIGARARFKLTDAFGIGVSGMKYDYDVNLVPDENRDAIRLVSVSRLGLINSLIDSRASINFSYAVGLSRWELDYSSWKGALDRARTDSVTVRYLRPTSNKTDIEFGLGYDDSDLYGDVTFASVYLYFYGR